MSVGEYHIYRYNPILQRARRYLPKSSMQIPIKIGWWSM